MAAGMPTSDAAVVATGSTRPSKPSLKISAATAPAAAAFVYFCVNGQVPRCIRAMLPAVEAGKSPGSQPLVPEPAPPGGGIWMSLVGTMFAVTLPDAANWATM